MGMGAQMVGTGPGAVKGLRVTGRTVLFAVLGFFGVVMGVNVVMAYLAISTFSGLQTEHPYETGLAFNKAVDEAQAQAGRGWTVDLHLDRAANGVVSIAAALRDAAGAPLSGETVTVGLRAPATATHDHSAMLAEAEAGAYRGTVSADPGQWDVELVATSNGKVLFRSTNRVILH